MDARTDQPVAQARVSACENPCLRDGLVLLTRGKRKLCNDIVYDFAMNIGEPEIAAGEAIR